ncbi:hypothetical protein ACC718_38850, partial [Rhizobium ruizarguesonis]
EAPNASAARQSVADDMPDLIVLDLVLPDTSGHDLLQAWRDEGLSLPACWASTRRMSYSFCDSFISWPSILTMRLTRSIDSPP